MLADFTLLDFQMIWRSPYRKIIYGLTFCTEVWSVLKNDVTVKIVRTGGTTRGKLQLYQPIGSPKLFGKTWWWNSENLRRIFSTGWRRWRFGFDSELEFNSRNFDQIDENRSEYYFTISTWQWLREQNSNFWKWTNSRIVLWRKLFTGKSTGKSIFPSECQFTKIGCKNDENFS